MTALVDTPVWSLAFRRRRSDLSAVEATLVEQLRRLIRGGNAHLIGPIRQEILSGVRERNIFEGLREDLRQHLDEPLGIEDFEFAAELSNRCRSAGVTGSPVDFLICAVASRRGWDIFTTDRDFGRYARHIEIRLHGISDVH